LLEPARLPEVALKLQAADFTRPECRAVFESAWEVWNASGSIDVELVADRLQTLGQLPDVGGIEGIVEMLEAVPHAVHLSAHVELLADLAQRRAILRARESKTAALLDRGLPLAEWEVLPDLPTGASSSTGGGPQWMDCVELSRSAGAVEWLSDWMIPKGKPLILGGPSKAGKTLLSIDLAVAVAMRGEFLGAECKQARVAVLSLESGAAALKRAAEGAAQSRGGTLADLRDGILWCVDPMDLCNLADLLRLSKMIKARGVELLVVDPAYLALAAVGDAASNQFKMGSALGGLSRLCADTGASLLLNCHFVKSAPPGQQWAMPELTWLAYGAFCQWARGWLLVNRRAPYDPERPGHHELWLNVGGSDGQSRGLALDLCEGRGDGESWGLAWRPASEERAERAADRAASRADRPTAADVHDRAAESALRTHARTWLPKSLVASYSKLSTGNAGAALSRLEAAGVAIQRPGERRGSSLWLLESALADVGEPVFRTSGHPGGQSDCPEPPHPEAGDASAPSGQADNACGGVGGRAHLFPDAAHTPAAGSRKGGKRRKRTRKREPVPSLEPVELAAVGDDLGVAP